MTEVIQHCNGNATAGDNRSTSFSLIDTHSHAQQRNNCSNKSEAIQVLRKAMGGVKFPEKSVTKVYGSTLLL